VPVKNGAISFYYSFSSVKKSALRAALLEKLGADLMLQTSAAHLARDEATSEESRAENKYDTHSQEAAYLAQGQARLATEIAANIEYYTSASLPDLAPADPIVTGTLIELEAGGRHAWYFLGARAGGIEFQIDGRDILVVTPQSPLGRQLLGKRVGDTVVLPGRNAGHGQRIEQVI
jgi:transcription elongation GreA/GreB family factor